jgi:hypothetical protein
MWDALWNGWIAPLPDVWTDAWFAAIRDIATLAVAGLSGYMALLATKMANSQAAIISAQHAMLVDKAAQECKYEFVKHHMPMGLEFRLINKGGRTIERVAWRVRRNDAAWVSKLTFNAEVLASSVPAGSTASGEYPHQIMPGDSAGLLRLLLWQDVDEATLTDKPFLEWDLVLVFAFGEIRQFEFTLLVGDDFMLMTRFHRHDRNWPVDKWPPTT